MKNKVAVIMGSQSDWPKMAAACETLEKLSIPFEKKIVSAHRTPDLLYSFAETAAEKGFAIIIAGAGGAAHLPGMVAAKTHLPVLGVPIHTKSMNGMDSLLSICQMPKGVPVGTLAIDGSINAALLAASIIALQDKDVEKRLKEFRDTQTQTVLDNPLRD